MINDSDRNGDARRASDDRVSPKRGAIPTPKDELEKALPYIPESDRDESDPSVEGDKHDA